MAYLHNGFSVEPHTIARYIDALGACGEQPDGGMIRYQYDKAWVAALEVLRGLMSEAGLVVHQDSVGNLFGTLAGTESSGTILTGSHIDTVRLGGKYDGALGVASGIAALGVLKETVGMPRKNLQVVALCEEEASRFHANYFGTRAMLGLVEPTEPDTLVDDEGVTLADAMRLVGLDPDRIGDAQRKDLEAFLELHIEQGRRLFDAGLDIGVVTAITGICWQTMTVQGRADHAGTTPMLSRKDAMRGAALMCGAIAEVALVTGDPAVATTGKWQVLPGGANIVPERVVFSTDMRHPNEAVLSNMVASVGRRCTEIAEELGLSVDIETVKQERPAPTDLLLRGIVAKSAVECGAATQDMPSGAGHDSQLMSYHTPTAMIFVPSVEGASHTKTEFTTPESCALGASVLATALHKLAY